MDFKKSWQISLSNRPETEKSAYPSVVYNVHLLMKFCFNES